MYFMFLKVIDVRFKDDIFMALQSAEINKATYFEALDLDKVLRDEIKIFKGLFDETKDIDKKGIIVTAYLPKKEMAFEFLDLLRNAGIDIDNKEILRLLVLPVDFVFEANIERNNKENA